MPGADLSRYSDAELQAMLAQADGGAATDLSQVPTEKLQAMLPQAAPVQAGIAGVGQPSAPAAAPIAPAGGTEALGRGALQGASLGFGDELAGFFAALGAPDSRIQYPEGAGFGERYATARDYYRGKNAGAKEAYPKTYVGGQIAGGLAVPGIGTVARAGQLSNGARIATLAGSGLTTGFLSGLGNAEGDVGDQLGEGVRGAVISGLVTPGLDTAARAVAAPLAATADGLRTGAGYALSRIAGGIQRDVKPAGGYRAFSNAGLEAYDRGLVSPLGSRASMEGKVADFARQSTDEITKAIDDAGARVAVAPLKQAILSGTDELRQFADANPAMLSKVDGLLKSLDKNADPAGTISARSLQTAKKVIDDFIATWDPFGKSSLAQGVNKALYSAVKEAQEEAVAASPGGAGQAAYIAAKKASALAQKLERFQASFEARRANQLASVGGLHGAGAGIAGIVQAITTGDPIAGLATYAGARVLTSPRTAAAVGLGASKLARVAPRYAASPLNPLLSRSAAQALVGSLERR